VDCPPQFKELVLLLIKPERFDHWYCNHSLPTVEMTAKQAIEDPDDEEFVWAVSHIIDEFHSRLKYVDLPEHLGVNQILSDAKAWRQSRIVA
jgi:hypothetical protein